jgi:hypothetical protein
MKDPVMVMYGFVIALCLFLASACTVVAYGFERGWLKCP